MIVIGSLITLALFVLVGWAVSVEMFRHRWWRKRGEAGDLRVIAGLILEAMRGWQRARPPQELSPSVWSAVQRAELVAVTADSATLSTAVEPEYRSEGGQRVQVASALDVAQAAAARLVDMMLYDVPNLRLRRVRVDVYTTFTDAHGVPVQRPVLSTVAERERAEGLPWEMLTPKEILHRFDTHVRLGEAGQPLPIELPPVEGESPDTIFGVEMPTGER